MAVCRAAREAAGREIRSATFQLSSSAHRGQRGRWDCAALASALQRAVAARPDLTSVEVVSGTCMGLHAWACMHDSTARKRMLHTYAAWMHERGTVEWPAARLLQHPAHRCTPEPPPKHPNARMQVLSDNNTVVDLSEDAAPCVQAAPTAAQAAVLAAAAMLPLRRLRRAALATQDAPVSVQPFAALARLATLDLSRCSHLSADLRHFSSLCCLTSLRLSGMCKARAPFELPGCGRAFAPMSVAHTLTKYDASDLAALAAAPALRDLAAPLPGELLFP